MSHKINRRDFLKVVASTATAASIGGFGVASGQISLPGDRSNCLSCNSVNVADVGRFLPSYLRPTEYCYGCGVNVHSQKYDFDCDFFR